MSDDQGAQQRAAITYPPDLPISQRRTELMKIIGENQVVVVAGETGSGKSTQIPKICLELGRGIDGFIDFARTRTGALSRRTSRLQGSIHRRGERKNTAQTDD